MDWKNDEVLKTLIEKGKETGSLTYDEVNAALPEGASDPDRLEDILELLDQNGISVIDDDEAEEREDGVAALVEEVLVADAEAAQFEDSDGDGRHIDDPVRMYLTQMGEIPLLDRKQEIALAKKIEVTRRRFRRKVLECDYALRQVVETLKRVHIRRPAVRPHHQGVADREPGEGQDPPADAAQPADARTADGSERRGLRAADRRAHAEKEQEELRERLRLRRRKTVTLVEELSIRTQKVQPLMKKLEQISQRMDELEGEIEALRGNRAAKEERANLEKELHDLMLITLEEPASLRKRVAIMKSAVRRVRAGQARTVRRQPAAGRLDRQEVPQPRPVLPRPDPGRQHRPDAGGGQVRVPPRLQVQHLRDVVDSPGDHPGHRRPGPDDPHPGPHDRDDVEAAQRLEEAAAGARPRADDRGDGQGRADHRRGEQAGAEDQPAPDQPGPAGRRERGQLLRRLHRGRLGRVAGHRPRRTRCSRTRSSTCSRR